MNSKLKKRINEIYNLKQKISNHVDDLIDQLNNCEKSKYNYNLDNDSDSSIYDMDSNDLIDIKSNDLIDIDYDLNDNFDDLDDDLDDDDSNKINFEDFQNHIPPWSAVINFNGERVKVKDTCTIDYLLLALWVINKINSNFINSLSSKGPTLIIKQIIEKIEIFDWNTARQLWIVNVMKFNINSKNISLYGSEYEMFKKYVSIYQLYNLKQKCDKKCINNNKISNKDGNILAFKKKNNKLEIYTFNNKRCKECNMNITYQYNFIEQPNILFFDSLDDIFLDEIPKSITLNKRNYRLLCTTLNYDKTHFISIFEINNQRYIVDDTKKNIILLPEKSTKSNYYNLKTGTSVYYIK